MSGFDYLDDTPTFICPSCGAECWREEVDIGVGTQHGPWMCPNCCWPEPHKWDTYPFAPDQLVCSVCGKKKPPEPHP